MLHISCHLNHSSLTALSTWKTFLSFLVGYSRTSLGDLTNWNCLLRDRNWWSDNGIFLRLEWILREYNWPLRSCAWESRSVLCRTALWDCFGDVITPFIGHWNDPIVQFDTSPDLFRFLFKNNRKEDLIIGETSLHLQPAFSIITLNCVPLEKKCSEWFSL